MIGKEEISSWFKGLQNQICQEFEVLDGKKHFHEDLWNRPGGGGGRSRVITDGAVIEKGGVNFSAVFGNTPEVILKNFGLEKGDFFATGVSIVIHPQNPFVPIIHMNVRYFEMSNGTFWFGGGIDLTPHYVNEKEAIFFHEALRQACGKYNSTYYPKFKTWADDYFFIKHRNETRGIGGIFFDRLTETESHDKKSLWEFVKDIGETFMPTYSELVKSNYDTAFDQRHRDWQLLRRGRYVEFNLVYDKGTKFGLDTDGRTESILMSMPPFARWEYDHKVSENSKEALTLSKLAKGIDW